MQAIRFLRLAPSRLSLPMFGAGRLAFLSLVLILTASSAAAQSFSVYTTDGLERTFELDSEELLDVIVEFRSPPLARVFPGQKGAVLGKGGAAAAAIERDHNQFRQDIAALVGSAVGFSKTGALTIRHEYRVTYNGVALSLPRAVVRRLDELPYVRRVSINREVRALVADARKLIHADVLAQRLGTSGEGIIVAILDTGIDYIHPDLGGGIGPGFKVTGGANTVDDSGSVLDKDGHGTHVAGIVAADGEIQGIAPKATLRAYKVLGDDGFGSTESVMAGIEQAVLDGVDIINMSLGSPGTADAPDAIAADNATLAGVLCVVSAGNAGDLNGTIGSPGNARLALTVGATDRRDWTTPFSSRGPSSGAYQIKPDVVAPGADIVSLGLAGGEATLSGTSMASPVVAGAAALLLELNPDWTPAMVKSALMNTADTIYDAKLNMDALPWSQGAGRVNVDKAADALFLVEPGSVSFGLVAVEPATWESEQTITLHNTSGQSQMFTIINQTALTSGATLSIEPTSISVGAGETGEVTVQLQIDNATVPMVGLPPGYHGLIAVAGGSQTVDVPYAFVKSNFLRVTFDEIDEVWIGVHDRVKKLEDYSFFCNPEVEYVIPLGSEVVDFMFVFIDSFDVVVHPEVDLKTAQQVMISRKQANLELTLRPVDKDGGAIELLPKERLAEDDTSSYAGLREGKTHLEYIGQDFGMGLMSHLTYDRFRSPSGPRTILSEASHMRIARLIGSCTNIPSR